MDVTLVLREARAANFRRACGDAVLSPTPFAARIISTAALNTRNATRHMEDASG